MKTYRDILAEKKDKEKKKFTIDQINKALLKAGIGPSIITKAINALNVARGLGIVERKDD